MQNSLFHCFSMCICVSRVPPHPLNVSFDNYVNIVNNCHSQKMCLFTSRFNFTRLITSQAGWCEHSSPRSHGYHGYLRYQSEASKPTVQSRAVKLVCREPSCAQSFVFSDQSMLLTLGLIHEPFLRTNLFLSPTYEVFTKIVAFMNVFLSRICS